MQFGVDVLHHNAKGQFILTFLSPCLGRQRHRGDPLGGGDQLLREPGGGHLLHRVHAPRGPLQLPLQLANLRLAQEVPLMQVTLDMLCNACTCMRTRFGNSSRDIDG